MTAESVPLPLYHSPWGLLPFQQEGVVRTITRPATLAAWDTGTGKSHLGMASAAILFEDEAIDLCLLVCEQNKVTEWVRDFERFTDLTAVSYYGTLAQRRKILDAVNTGQPTTIKRGLVITKPQVLVSTYETFRNDMASMQTSTSDSGRRTKRLTPNVLTKVLEGKRLFVGYDEMTKLGNRGSGLHKAHALFVSQIRKSGGEVRILGMTATPMDKDPESYYNLGRILDPLAVGTVASFDEDHVAVRDQFGNASRFKNLTPETTFDPRVTPMSSKMGGVLIRKRKSDDDIRSQFPETSERFVPVMLGDRHQDFYEAVAEMLADVEDRSVVTLMRQIVGHPLALLHSEGRIAKDIVSEVGEDGLRAMGSAKLDVLVERLRPVVLQGDRAVVFTFFGPSMIPLIAERLTAEGIVVAQHYGALTTDQNEQAKDDFREGRVSVLLSSDSGARGINLPQAAYAFEYDIALTHATRTQRLNRIHRIDSREYGTDKVYFQSLVAQHTIEDAILRTQLRRNGWSDELLGDTDAGEHLMTAEQRKSMLAISRRNPVR